MELLLETAEGLQVTFHMAFDAIPAARQFKAIDWLAEHGVQRIFDPWWCCRHPIEANFDRLKELIAYAGERLTILPGGGISFENAQEVADTLGVKEVHGTRIVDLND